jgi:hypothetical protein
MNLQNVKMYVQDVDAEKKSSVVNGPEEAEDMVNITVSGGTERKRSGVAAFWFFWSKCKIEERLWPDSWVKRNMSIFVR